MVITKKTTLPTIEELTVPEVDVTSAHLMAAAPFVGKLCEAINNEFMLCRHETKDPRTCLALGKEVTKCTLAFFSRAKKFCSYEQNQYVNCIDKSSGNYQAWPCRKTCAVYEECIKKRFKIEHPGFGYFTRGRVHKTERPKPDPDVCTWPGMPKPGEETPHLPEDRPKPKARFTGRTYWQTE